MSENIKNCPICPRHCDLTEPHCGRGEEYARTGQLPQEGERGHEHGEEHGHGHEHNHGREHEHGHPHGHEHEHSHGHEHGHEHEHGRPRRLQFETREQQLVMKYLHHAVGAADRGGLTQENAKDMFSVLTEEEILQLSKLLEKLSDHWMTLAPNKPVGHPGHHDSAIPRE